MFSIHHFKNLWVVPVLALPLLVWLLSAASVEAPKGLSPEKVNLALRRTADRLLAAVHGLGYRLETGRGAQG